MWFYFYIKNFVYTNFVYKICNKIYIHIVVFVFLILCVNVRSREFAVIIEPNGYTTKYKEDGDKFNAGNANSGNAGHINSGSLNAGHANSWNAGHASSGIYDNINSGIFNDGVISGGTQHSFKNNNSSLSNRYVPDPLYRSGMPVGTNVQNSSGYSGVNQRPNGWIQNSTYGPEPVGLNGFQYYNAHNYQQQSGQSMNPIDNININQMAEMIVKGMNNNPPIRNQTSDNITQKDANSISDDNDDKDESEDKDESDDGEDEEKDTKNKIKKNDREKDIQDDEQNSDDEEGTEDSEPVKKKNKDEKDDSKKRRSSNYKKHSPMTNTDRTDNDAQMNDISFDDSEFYQNSAYSVDDLAQFIGEAKSEVRNAQNKNENSEVNETVVQDDSKASVNSNNDLKMENDKGSDDHTDNDIKNKSKQSNSKPALIDTNINNDQEEKDQNKIEKNYQKNSKKKKNHAKNDEGDENDYLDNEGFKDDDKVENDEDNQKNHSKNNKIKSKKHKRHDDFHDFDDNFNDDTSDDYDSNDDLNHENNQKTHKKGHDQSINMNKHDATEADEINKNVDEINKNVAIFDEEDSSAYADHDDGIGGLSHSQKGKHIFSLFNKFSQDTPFDHLQEKQLIEFIQQNNSDFDIQFIINNNKRACGNCNRCDVCQKYNQHMLKIKKLYDKFNINLRNQDSDNKFLYYVYNNLITQEQYDFLFENWNDSYQNIQNNKFNMYINGLSVMKNGNLLNSTKINKAQYDDMIENDKYNFYLNNKNNINHNNKIDNSRRMNNKKQFDSYDNNDMKKLKISLQDNNKLSENQSNVLLDTRFQNMHMFVAKAPFEVMTSNNVHSYGLNV